MNAREMYENAVTKREEAFATMMESQSDDNIKAYENACKVAEIAEKNLERTEKKAMEERNQKNDFNAPNPELSESAKWVKALREAVAVGSAYTGLIPATIATAIVKKQYEYSNFLKRVTTHNLTGTYTFAVEGTGVSVAYVEEGATIGDSTPTVGTVKLDALKLGALVKISNEALADVAFDFENYIVESCAKEFALKIDAEILKGTGTKAITGIIPACTNTVTSTLTTAFSWAELKKTIAALKAYRKNAILVCSSATADLIHEFKDGSNYIFDQNRPLESVMGLPVVISPDMDDVATGKNAVLVGDFSYYHVGIRKAFDVQADRSVFFTSDQTAIRAIERVDGKPALVNEAFAVLAIK